MAWKRLWRRAVLSSVLMGAWLQGHFLRPLADEAADMVCLLRYQYSYHLFDGST